MERIELLDMVIDHVKRLAKPGDRQMAYLKNAKGELILTLIATEEKYETKLALKALKDSTGCKEMVFVSEAWMSLTDKDKDFPPKVMPSQDPNRKECFVINYFSNDKCLMHALIFERVKGNKLKWVKEINYWEGGEGGESTFNVFKYTEKQVQELLDHAKVEEVRKNGKMELVELPMNFSMKIYRFEDKVFFEAFNGKGEMFGSSKVMKDDEEAEAKLKLTIDTIRLAGDLCEKQDS